MAGLRQKKKEQREQRILEAARCLFIRKGFAETSIEGIAEHAEVGVGTVYNYFRSKDELLIAIIVRATDDVIDAGKVVIADPPADPVTGFTALFDIYTECFTEFEKGLMRDMFSAFFRHGQLVDNELVEQDFRIVVQISQLIEYYSAEGKIESDFATQQAALALYGQFFMNFLIYAATDTMSLDEVKMAMAAQLDIFFYGLLSLEIKCGKQGPFKIF